jgi:hypothetical protein
MAARAAVVCDRASMATVATRAMLERRGMRLPARDALDAALGLKLFGKLME